MQEFTESSIIDLISRQRSFFISGETKCLKFRLDNLIRFRKAVKAYEKKISDALWIDLHKSAEEAYLTETSIVLQELDNHIRHLSRWSKPKRVPSPMVIWPSKSWILYEPLGVSLIMAPWNYPFQLLMNPLIGAISSGCCAVLKPSPYTPHIADVMEELIRETFHPDYITVVQGNREINTILLRQRFDFIFYTGSPDVGKVVMKAAAEHLTPLVLELGGKSPCIVDATANLDLAAKRIAWGKTINAGQTCIAPDYLLVHHSVKEELIQKIASHLNRMFGPDAAQSPYFPRIINQKAFERLLRLLEHGTIRFGGQSHAEDRFISPTLIDDVQPDFPIMQEEIFGPILPILTYEDIHQAISFIQSREKPLALYYFGENRIAGEVLRSTTSGGSCINDTLMHIINHRLPFGGVGNSGLGKYHGRQSFLAFSNVRSVVKSSARIDLPFKYVPFKGFRWTKKLV